MNLASFCVEKNSVEIQPKILVRGKLCYRGQLHWRKISSLNLSRKYLTYITSHRSKQKKRQRENTRRNKQNQDLPKTDIYNCHQQIEISGASELKWSSMGETTVENGLHLPNRRIGSATKAVPCSKFPLSAMKRTEMVLFSGYLQNSGTPTLYLWKEDLNLLQRSSNFGTGDQTQEKPQKTNAHWTCVCQIRILQIQRVILVI